MYQAHKKTFIAGAGANNVVATGRCILHKILVGADVASGDIEVSDHPSDGDINVVAQFTGSTLMTSLGGGVDIGMIMEKGICLDLTNQTKVTVVWEPIGR